MGEPCDFDVCLLYLAGFSLFLAPVQGVLSTQPPSLPLHQGVPSLQRSQRGFSSLGCEMVLASTHTSSCSPTRAPKRLVQNQSVQKLLASSQPGPCQHPRVTHWSGAEEAFCREKMGLSQSPGI